jgi:class 3 adenylate cyclase
MGWNYNRSLKRIDAHLDGMGEITIEKLKREADLWSLLSETNCREIFGAHVYVDVANFSSLASRASATKEDLKRLAQGVHIYQREVARIVERAETFDAVRVHFQGARLHALFYRPIDNATKIAARAVLLELVLRDFVDSVFNPAFPKLGDFRTAAATDIGDTIGTQNGVEGDRELLFVGGPANKAAKTLGSTGTDRLTAAVFNALPEDLQALCVEVSDASVYALGDVSQEELDALCAAHGVRWNRGDSEERIAEDRKQFPLADIEIESADMLIDLDLLSVRRNKRVTAASVFADLTGFTAYVERAESTGKQKEALRVLHAVRKEFSRVLTDDYNGVRIQYQGDRVQAVFHLPKDNDESIAQKAVDAAAGIQSSLETTLKVKLPEAKDLHVAIGVDVGLTLVSRFGARGARDPICLGEAVQNAARIEEAVDGRDTGVSSAVHSHLSEAHQDLFGWRSKAQAYVASALTADKLERATDASAMFAQTGSVYVKTVAGVTTVSSEVTRSARAVAASKPYRR